MAKAAAQPAAEPVILHAIRPADMSPIVEKWNPNPSFEKAETPVAAELPPSSEDETPAETPAAKETEKPAPDKPETEAPAEAEEGEKPAAAAPAAKPDRRAEIRAAIEKQKEKLGLETAVTAERKKREALEAEVERLKKAPLRELLKFRGLDPQAVQDQALIGGDLWADDEKPAAAAPVGNLPPEVAAKLARLDAIEARLADQDKTTQQQAIANAITGVRDTLKAADVPALKLTPGGYQRVLQTAHEAWSASGKKGSAWDYVADAAAIVEDEIRAENPDLAETVDLARKARGTKPAAEEETTEEKPADPPKPTRVAVGKKVGTTPSVKPKALPRDRDARDREVKRMMGWD